MKRLFWWLVGLLGYKREPKHFTLSVHSARIGTEAKLKRR